MPLVVPGIQNTDGGDSADWESKLMGKKIGDNHDEVVRFAPCPLPFPRPVSSNSGRGCE